MCVIFFILMLCSSTSPSASWSVSTILFTLLLTSDDGKWEKNFSYFRLLVYASNFITFSNIFPTLTDKMTFEVRSMMLDLVCLCTHIILLKWNEWGCSAQLWKIINFNNFHKMRKIRYCQFLCIIVVPESWNKRSNWLELISWYFPYRYSLPTHIPPTLVRGCKIYVSVIRCQWKSI